MCAQTLDSGEGKSLLEKLRQRAQAVPATIVYPEPEDERILEAASRAAEAGIARPLLVGKGEDLPETLPDGVKAVDIQESEALEKYIGVYAEKRGMSERVAGRMLTRPLVYGGMMVATGDADGMVAGVAHPTASVIQAAGLSIGYQPGIKSGSSCFIMVVPQLRGEKDVPLIFADCAVSIAPSTEELADIALSSALSARQFLNVTPRVAMLSFSTAGSAAHEYVDKVKEATRIAADKIEGGYVEGELQLDAALNPTVAEKKGVGDGEVAGQANVLVFPDLNAANICYKAVQELGGAQAVGPVLQGFARPVNDLSRGARVDDIVATTVITVIQTQS